jgi:phosphoribosylglycinamide formyltransferase 1
MDENSEIREARASSSSSGRNRETMPIAVLISGGGSTLLNLLAHIEAGQLTLDIRLVLSSSKRAAGLRHAHEAGISHHIVRRRDFASPQEHSEALFGACREARVELVVMGGFLEHVLIPEDFLNRAVNIHPSLIPAFCGHGFYGLRVHEAVLEYGAKVTGCTVHFVDNVYDHGPIILQRAVPVLDDDTPQSLAARVFAEECRAYPEALQLYAEGRIQVVGRKVRIATRKN